MHVLRDTQQALPPYGQGMPAQVHGRRPTQEERRSRTGAALLSAAVDLVVESGVRSLTLARVGERAGYSRGIVTHHFGSKQALVDALARATQTAFVVEVVDRPPGLERLLTLIEGYLRALGEAEVKNRAFLLLWAEALSTPGLATIFRERDDAFRADLRADVAAAISAGDVPADTEADDVAVAVLGQLRGIALQRMLEPDAVHLGPLGRLLVRQWRRSLSSHAR